MQYDSVKFSFKDFEDVVGVWNNKIFQDIKILILLFLPKRF